MILLWGLPNEGPLARVRQALSARGAPILMLDQRQMLNVQCEWQLAGDTASGTLSVDGVTVALADIDAVYVRALDVGVLPSVRAAAPAARARAHDTHAALLSWCEAAPIRVVNRAAAMVSNFSKPYQAQLIAAHGFLIPETLITNDPAAARAFVVQHGAVIYKSISGVRSIARRYAARDEARLHQIRWCPTQFQQFVAGVNVRVHVVADRVFATAIASDAVDYRYAARDGMDACLLPTQLDDDVAQRCVELTAALGLTFAGIDLKFTPEDEVFCFEVNPSPGFSYFEAHTEQPIADAVAEELLAGAPRR
jgi:glutathione synthase/RimK-type ligase-like ATP-grasp enzyme